MPIIARSPLMLSLLLVACGGGAAQAGANPLPSPDDASADLGASSDAPAADDASDASAVDVEPPVDAPSGAPCALRPACDAPLPDLGAKRSFRHTLPIKSSPRHRGRDLFLAEGKPQWALAKFAYTALDDDLKDEDVDLWLLRDCGSTWTKVGTYRTTSDGDHAAVYGVDDTGGRIFVDLASTGIAPLGLGRHRLLFAVAGDLTTTDQIVEIVPTDAKIVVSDIDGTLTTSEYASVTSAVGLGQPAANPGAADVMTAFARRGYYLFYLTARPEWLMPMTREWLPLRAFPPGLVHTTLSGTGATGASATTYKTSELAMLKATTGIVPTYAFGNKDTDVAAYANGGIAPSRSYYFQMTADPKGGVVHDDYSKLVPMASAAPPNRCP